MKCILGLFCLLAGCSAVFAEAGSQAPASTTFTRQVLTNTTAAGVLNALGVVNSTNIATFNTGQFSVSGTNVSIASGVLLTNPVFTGGVATSTNNGITSTNWSVALSQTAAAQRGIFRTPSMGMYTWFWKGPFGVEADYTSRMDIIGTNKLYQFGWKWIEITDGWQYTNRVNGGHMTWNSNYFPDGLPWLIAYAHTNHCLVSIYLEPNDTNTASAGTTGLNTPGSLGHLAQDVTDFIRWGVDGIRQDYQGHNNAEAAYFAQLTAATCQSVTNKPIALFMAGWDGTNFNLPVVASAPNAIQITADIGDLTYQDDFSFFVKFLSHVRRAQQFSYLSGPGHYVLPEYLPTTQGQTMLSAYAMLSSPLMVGVINSWAESNTRFSYLTNAEWIAIDQDAMGVAGLPVLSNATSEVWLKPLANGDKAVLLLNTSTNASVTVGLDVTDIGFPAGTILSARDVWAHTNLTLNTTYTNTLAAMTGLLFRLSTAPPPATWYTNYIFARDATTSQGTYLQVNVNYSPSPFFYEEGIMETLTSDLINIPVPDEATNAVLYYKFQCDSLASATNSISTAYYYTNNAVGRVTVLRTNQVNVTDTNPLTYAVPLTWPATNMSKAIRFSIATTNSGAPRKFYVGPYKLVWQ